MPRRIAKPMRDFFAEVGIGQAQGVELFRRMSEFLFANPDHQIRSNHFGRFYIRNESERFFVNNGSTYRLPPRSVVAMKVLTRKSELVDPQDLPTEYTLFIRSATSLGLRAPDWDLTVRVGEVLSSRNEWPKEGEHEITAHRTTLGDERVTLEIPIGIPIPNSGGRWDVRRSRFDVKRVGDSIDIDLQPESNPFGQNNTGVPDQYYLANVEPGSATVASHHFPAKFHSNADAKRCMQWLSGAAGAPL